MALAEKEQEVRELAELLANSKSIYLTDFQGMNVELVSRMRRKLRDAKVEYRVAKNTLTKRALKDHGVTSLDSYLEGPTGIAYDKASNRIFSGCNNTSVVVDADTGKIVASIKNGTRVDALGWDPSKKLIFIPNGGEGNVTVVHQDSPDKYTTVATVDTFAGAKTIAVDPVTHNAYLFQPERGPAPRSRA